MRRMSKRGAVVASAVAGVVVVALPAWAYFALTSTTATTTVTAAALGTPVAGTPSVSAASVSFSVSAPASGLAPAGFRVDRTAPSAAAGVCSFPTAAGGTCTDPAPVGGQTNTYAVYAVRGGWESIAPATVTANVPAAVRGFTLTPSTSAPTAGTPFNATLTATLNGVTDTAYTGAKTINWSGGQTIGSFPPAYPGAVTFTNGVATVSVTLHKAGAQTLTATDANTVGYTGSGSVTVAAATPRLAFSSCPATRPRNTTFTTTVTRTGTDPYGNSTGTAAITVTLAPSSGNAKFATASTTLGAGVLASGTLTVNTASSANVVTNYTASATGYTTATCSVTTTS